MKKIYLLVLSFLVTRLSLAQDLPVQVLHVKVDFLHHVNCATTITTIYNGTNQQVVTNYYSLAEWQQASNLLVVMKPEKRNPRLIELDATWSPLFVSDTNGDVVATNRYYGLFQSSTNMVDWTTQCQFLVGTHGRTFPYQQYVWDSNMFFRAGSSLVLTNQ